MTINIGFFFETISQKDHSRFSEYLGFFDNNKDIKVHKKFNKEMVYDIGFMVNFYNQWKNTSENMNKNNHYYKRFQLYNNAKVKRWVFLDRDLLDCLKKLTPSDLKIHQYRIMIDSPYRSKAIQFDSLGYDDLRISKMLKERNLKIKEWELKGENILFLLPGLTHVSIGNINIDKWIYDKVKFIRNFTKRPISIRCKEGGTTANEIIKKFPGKINDCHASKEKDLTADLDNAYVTVHLPTSAAFGSIIKGIPTFTDSVDSPIYEISNHDFSRIEDPEFYDVTDFMKRLGYRLYGRQDFHTKDFWNKLFVLTGVTYSV